MLNSMAWGYRPDALTLEMRISPSGAGLGPAALPSFFAGPSLDRGAIGGWPGPNESDWPASLLSGSTGFAIVDFGPASAAISTGRVVGISSRRAAVTAILIPHAARANALAAAANQPSLGCTGLGEWRAAASARRSEATSGTRRSGSVSKHRMTTPSMRGGTLANWDGGANRPIGSCRVSN